MRRKILAVLLAAAMAISLLAGCGGGKALSQVIVDLLDNLYSNVSVEADSDLTAALKQAAAEGGTEEEILSRMIEILNHKGGSITFTLLGSGQQGNHAVTLYFQTGTDPDAAARNALAQWAGTLGTLPDDGSYQADVAMIETENGYYVALDVEVLKAGKPDKPDKPDSGPTLGPTDVGFANDDYSVSGTEEQKTFNVKTGTGLVAWANYVRAENWNTNCTLEADVTLTGSWEPIGNDETPYTGTFDGNGKTVTGLAITSSNRYVGMFGYVTGTVQNVNLEQVTVTNNYTEQYQAGFTGAVAGYLSGTGTITGCSVSGSVTITGPNGNAGGVVGSNSGIISNCKVNTLTIKGANSNGNVAGGVAGTNSKTIENCQVDDLTITDVTTAGGVMGKDESSNAALTGCSVNDSSVTGNNHAGGVAGILYYGNLAGCSVENTTITTNNITGQSGGVIGGQSGGTATACYFAKGSINGKGVAPFLGGVAGAQSGGSIIACYSTGGFGTGASSTSYLGGVVGNHDMRGVVTDCYWSGLPDNDNGGATKVDGQSVTWQKAVDAMNAALQNAGSEWRYELTGALPTLKKQ